MKRNLADLAARVASAGVLTGWAQGYWPVALVQIGAFLIAGIWLAWVAIARQTVQAGFMLLPVCAGALWGSLQLAAGQSVYRFETGKAVLSWTACASVFLVAREVSAGTAERNRLLRSVLWFGAAVSLLAVVQFHL